MAAVYSVFTSPNHAPIPNHLPTLIVTPHGQPSNILYSYLHTNFNAENYLLTPSPQGDLCVAKLFPPARGGAAAKYAASDPGHSSGSSSARAVRCEASRNLKWTIANTGVMSPIYKLSLPSPDSPDLPLFQVSKPNPNANFWSMFYFAYAGHLIPPKRIEFGKIQKNPPGPGGGGTRISITGKTPEEKAVWQTLGEGNEDCVEWVVLCAALNLLDDEILKAAEKAGAAPSPSPAPGTPASGPPPAQSRQGSFNTPPNGPGGAPPQSRQGSFDRPPPNGAGQRPPPQQYPSNSSNGSGGPQRGGPPPGQGGPPPQGYPQQRGPPPPNGQFPPQQRPPNGQYPSQGPPQGQRGPPPQGYPQGGTPPQGQRGPGGPPPQGYPQQGGPPPQQRGPPPQGYPQQGGPPPQQGQRGPPPQGYPQQGGPGRSGSVPPPPPQGGGGGRRV